MTTASTFEPAASPAILAAIQWVQGALLGTVATSIAIICVAGLGYQCLTGRIPARRAITVLLGCFILFGSAHIAAALHGLAGVEPGPVAAMREPAISRLEDSRAPSRSAPDPFNPYGGE